jgi:hypothetical protein
MFTDIIHITSVNIMPFGAFLPEKIKKFIIFVKTDEVSVGLHDF